MFPLGTTLLPGSGLPLRVFEPRYQQMVRDVLASDGPPVFGQVLITHGHEAGGGDVRSEVGTLARMADIQAVGDGRYTFLAIGTERIRIVEWLPDDPYPRAHVESWPDDRPGDRPGDLPGEDAAAFGDRIGVTTERLRHVLDLAARVAGADVQELPGLPREPAEDLSLATYRLAAIAPIGPADRYRLLAAPGPLERLDALEASLDDAEAMLMFRLS
jgi:hypothetical protein